MKTTPRAVTLAASVALMGLLGLSACSAPSGGAEQSPASSVQAPAEPAEPSAPAGPAPLANAPTDGVWEAGDVSYGSPTPVRESAAGPRDEYTFTVSGPPTLTTADGGATVLMSSAIAVTRVHDKGFGKPISESENFWFAPGSNAELTMSETYGTYTDVACERDVLTVGESTTCTVAFEAPVNEIQDSYWEINQLRVGTWPSQLATV